MAYVNVSGLNPACTGYQATTCKVSLPLGKAGTYALTFLAFDAVQKSASGPFVGRPLETNETSFNYTGANNSTYTVALDGIPAYFTVSPNGNGFLQGSRSGLTLYGSSPQQVLVAALDRDGNPIIGPGSPSLGVQSSSTGVLTVTAVGSTNPNAFIIQAKTSGTPGMVTPGVVQLTVQANQPTSSGAGSVSTSVAVRVTHSLLAVATQSGNVYGYFDSQTSSKVMFKSPNLPRAISFDRLGNLFLGTDSPRDPKSNAVSREIDEYPASNQSTPTLKLLSLNDFGAIDDTLNAITVDSSGDIFAGTGYDVGGNSGSYGGSFEVLSGATTAEYYKSSGGFVTALAVNPNNTLFAAYQFSVECHATCTTPYENVSNTACCSGYQDVAGIAVDTAGFVRISRIASGHLEKWPVGTGAMTSYISIGAGAIAIDSANTLYNASTSSVDIYPGATTPKGSSLAITGEKISAIAIYPYSAMTF